MTEVSGAAQPATPCDATPCRELAAREFTAWFDDPDRSAIARRTHGDRASLERVLSLRLEGVLAHDRPCSANRRWLCDSIRAWAPLEVIFPTRDYSGLAGVSGELPRHSALLVERAYGHVLAATRSIHGACDLLRAEAQLLEMQITVATALQRLLQAPAESASAVPGEWPRDLREMSLAMAEFLHRHSIGLSPVLADPVVMTYTSQISKLRRNLDDACRRARAA